MTLFGELKLSILYNSGTNVQELKCEYNTSTPSIVTHEIYTNTALRWINVNIQAKPSEIMSVNAYDIETFVLEPTASYDFTNLGTFTNSTITLKMGSSSEGVYIGEMKIFSYDSSNSKGIFYRDYNIIANIPTSMVEYFRVTNGDVVYNGHNTTVSSAAFGDTIDLPFEF